MKYTKKIIRYLENQYSHFFCSHAVRRIITPFTPYLICKYHLSREIHRRRVGWINRQSKDLTKYAREVRAQDWIFCDVDLIPMFVDTILPQIQKPFILITGKWYLPGLEESKHTGELIRSEKVILWFSQNMCINHPKCHPFPYGVRHDRAWRVLREMERPIMNRKKEIYFGHLRVYKHLARAQKAVRMALRDRMDKWCPLPMYLAKLHQYCFVVSPQGDRPETYRHWEAIALGCVPISYVPDPYKKLFGQNMIYVDKGEDLLRLNADNLTYSCPDVRIVTVSYWINRIKDLEQRMVL